MAPRTAALSSTTRIHGLRGRDIAWKTTTVLSRRQYEFMHFSASKLPPSKQRVGADGQETITSKPSNHRVSRSLPRLDAAFQHLGVRKALRLVFRCLTDSARFARSPSIEDDFLGLW